MQSCVWGKLKVYHKADQQEKKTVTFTVVNAGTEWPKTPVTLPRGYSRLRNRLAPRFLAIEPTGQGRPSYRHAVHSQRTTATIRFFDKV